MRKLLLAAAGAFALGTASVANAAIVIDASTGLDTPIGVANAPTIDTVDFGLNPAPAGDFTGTFDFTNDLNGMYSILLGSSTPGTTFSSASLVGIAGTAANISVTGSSNVLSLLSGTLDPGSYRFTFAGNAPAGGAAVSGNLTFGATPVPEPTTWAMMLLGFGALGLVLRSRRRTTLAQLA
jgi:hypothetical protein